MADIILGSDPISRPSASPSGYTYIYMANPATVDGWITAFQVYFHTAPSVFKVGLFYLVSGPTWRCRNSVTVEGISSGLQTIDGLVMEVRAGDYIGFWHQGGTLARHDSGGVGARYISGEYTDPGDEASFALISSGRILSVRGIGTTDFVPPVVLDSLTENLFADLNPVFRGYPQPVYDYSLNASNSEDQVTLAATLDGATIKYSYGGVVDKEVPSGVGETIPLAIGANVVTITVEKAGYETKTYTVTITRIGIVDWEYILPNGDTGTKSLKTYPASPSSHYDKVRAQTTGANVYWDLAFEVGDLWSFDKPVQREKPDVKKVRFFVVGFRNNPLAWGKFAVYTNGALYKGPQNTWAGYQSPGSEYYTLTSNPITGNPWTLEEIDALLAGEYHFDSGIPSRVGSYWYYLSIVYENASVRTDKATGYTGNTVVLNGTVTNTEGTFLDPYTPLGDNLLRVRFEWGKTIAYGNTTAYQMGVTGAFSANLSGLDPAKTYHYRAVVEVRADSRIGGFDVYYGNDMVFPGAGGLVGRSLVDRLASEGAI
ncbi:MAG: cadherin-like beta sandwich domain-containing protein [Candidatus Omnitrophica bacterium]|nr:cadherin-like beta sandwich domain-containing protein [Candidatus Omnitrophota bacterium]